jgi:hypothetical protein
MLSVIYAECRVSPIVKMRIRMPSVIFLNAITLNVMAIIDNNFQIHRRQIKSFRDLKFDSHFQQNNSCQHHDIEHNYTRLNDTRINDT